VWPDLDACSCRLEDPRHRHCRGCGIALWGRGNHWWWCGLCIAENVQPLQQQRDRELHARWVAEHRDEVNKANRAHYYANREERLRRHATYRAEHRDEINRQKREHYATHRDEIRQRWRENYSARKMAAVAA